jgi:predicted site-specific integrase-resolvase
VANHKDRLEPLLTPKDVARWLQLSERGVQSLTAKGTLPAIKLSYKVLRYRRQDIEQQFRRRVT